MIGASDEDNATATATKSISRTFDEDVIIDFIQASLGQR
jgi:hypothetical protein